MLPDLNSLYQNLHQRLRAFILRRVSDEAAAEDILQDVFLKTHARLASRQNHDRLEAWVYQIARNAIIDYYRRARPLTDLSDDLPLPADEDPDPAAALALSLREMVEALPEPYRQALLLTEFEGLSQVELAERLGISLSGAKSRVQRARQKVKDALLTCCHIEFDRRGRVLDYWEHCCCCAA